MSKPTFIVISGTQACGKTRNASALKDAYGCHDVVDDWQGDLRSATVRTAAVYRSRAGIDGKAIPLKDFRLLLLTSRAIGSLEIFCSQAHGLGFDVLMYSYDTAMRGVRPVFMPPAMSAPYAGTPSEEPEIASPTGRIKGHAFVNRKGDLTVAFMHDGTAFLKKHKVPQTLDLSATEVRLLAKMLMAELLK